MMPRRRVILKEMGLTPLWRLRGRTASSPQKMEPVNAPVSYAHGPSTNTSRPAETNIADMPVINVQDMDWDTLEETIRTCTRCELYQRRHQVVPGTGNRQARWLFIGEGPGAEEDRLGEPFVGQAGKLLDQMLLSLGLSRQKNVYICNVVKCRPPMNRTPMANEIHCCFPFLQRQIALVAPEVIVALGRPAAQALLGMEDVRINRVRGHQFRYQDIPVVVTYHPAYLLRNPADKKKVWEDLCFARSVITQKQNSGT